MEQKELIEILRVGLKAVSPYNSQPWEFQFHNDQLIIRPKFNERGFLGNVRNVILYSLGAFLENLSEGAKHFHYQISYVLLSKEVEMGKPLCAVTFNKTSGSPDHDIRHVMSRYTNRKIYRPQSLPPAVLEKIRSYFQGGTRAILDVTNNHAFINSCSLLERIRIANLEFNEELMDVLCFSEKEAQERRRGLDMRVLELPLIAQLFLRAEKNFFFRKTIGRSVLAQRVAESAKKKSLYGCPLLIAFKNTDDSADVLVRDWMDIQKTLNHLRQEGLHSQLLATSTDLIKIKRSFYLPAERKVLEQADINIEKSIGTKLSSVLCLLRVGYADECPVTSLRVEPEELLLDPAQ